MKNETDIWFILSTVLRDIIKYNVADNLLPELRTYFGPNQTAQYIQVKRLAQVSVVTKARSAAYDPHSLGN